MCLISCERARKRDPHKTFAGGGVVGQRGGSRRAVLGSLKEG